MKTDIYLRFMWWYMSAVSRCAVGSREMFTMTVAAHVIVENLNRKFYVDSFFAR